MRTGVIAAIRVQDGQVVKQGEVLIELDPTQNQADRDRASNEYRAAKVEAARLQALDRGRSHICRAAGQRSPICPSPATTAS